MVATKDPNEGMALCDERRIGMVQRHNFLMLDDGRVKCQACGLEAARWK